MFKGGLLRSFLSSNSSNPNLTPFEGPSGRMVNDDSSSRSFGAVSEAPSSEDIFGQDDTVSIAESSSSRGASSTMSSRRESSPPSYTELDITNGRRSRPLSSFTQASSSSSSTQASSSSSSSSSSALDSEDAAEQRRRRARRKQGDAFGALGRLQSISESNASTSNLSTHSSASFTPSLFGINSSYAKQMEETGRLRRLQSQQVVTPVVSSALAPTDTKRPITPDSGFSSPLSSAAGPSRSRARPESEILPPYVSPTDVTFDVPSITEPEPEPEPDNDPEPSTPSNSPIPDEQPSEDQSDVQMRLTQTLRELEEAKATARRIAVEREEEKAALLSRVETSERWAEQLNRELETQRRILEDTRSELIQMRANYSALSYEKRGWKDKFEVMHHKLQRAERQMRCLDHITRAKVEARQAAHAQSVRRTKQIMAMELKPSVEVINAVEVLNEEILQLANLFVEYLERTTTARASDDDVQRAKMVLGDGMTEMMVTQAGSNPRDGFRQLLMQVALEVFMTFWCSAIIDGYYPKQESFADLLLEMSSSSLVNASRKGHIPRIECGNPIQVVKVHAATNMSSKFSEWVYDIIDDLETILLVGGVHLVHSDQPNMLSSKILGLVKLSYNLRTALAERDLSGGLDLYMVAPDTPFQSKWMDEGHEAQTQVSDQDVEPIAGTSGLGLSRDTSNGQYYQDGRVDSRFKMILKPKVVLLRVLHENE
ncbi:hypothetical protein BDN70DRAFT_925394 [Pholiota conissans]|uniref:Uncharacterized protein n=1 Tax=Pholiota conissans TaxID=109636 RepID=A0A9P5YPH5_9AGAR|nr:hypothetical protein BDN70DRAFT_925394 [Pholiota conissans]